MPGVMHNPEDENSVIKLINAKTYSKLKAEGVISGGMIPKLDNAFEAISQGVSRVVITHFNDIVAKIGTTIV
jgi:acetylglutamate kinase